MSSEEHCTIHLRTEDGGLKRVARALQIQPMDFMAPGFPGTCRSCVSEDRGFRCGVGQVPAVRLLDSNRSSGTHLRV